MAFESGKFSVRDILRMIGGKEFILQPNFQRFYIWTLSKEQSLIDSILRGYPIPPIWIWSHPNEDGDNVYEVIDGQQRITCIQRFTGNEFIFKESKGTPGNIDISEANNCYFDSVTPSKNGGILKKEYRKSILNYRIPYIEVSTEDREQIIDIFSRLNKSSTNLNPQEMRNAFYTGVFKSFIYKITDVYQEDDYWGRGDRVFS